MSGIIPKFLMVNRLIKRHEKPIHMMPYSSKPVYALFLNEFSKLRIGDNFLIFDQNLHISLIINKQ